LFSGSKEFVQSVDLNIVGGTVLEPFGPPFLFSGQVLGTLEGSIPKKEIEHYVVEEGDTLASIAEKFNISLETLLWANDLTQKSVISPGKELIILPVSGILHIVGEGDTVGELANIYKTDYQQIVEFNELSEKGEIFVGDILIIPGGKKPAAPLKYTQVPLPQSYFICPVPSPCRISQGLHWYNAIDFSNNKCGEPVFAAAGGEVQRTGYGDVSGYYVRILHQNGVVTFYGHLSKIAVAPGQRVSQGETIGYVGHSGVTIPRGSEGCHLHFDVRFAKNPFAGYAVGTELGK